MVKQELRVKSQRIPWPGIICHHAHPQSVYYNCVKIH